VDDSEPRQLLHSWWSAPVLKGEAVKIFASAYYAYFIFISTLDN